jgi:two-component system, chemotaxis family, chemotaxis protein CheY
MQLKEATVLIVDDEAELLEIMAAWFERAQCHVLTAVNGVQALEKIRAERVHVLVSDIRMPVMDGVSLLENIKASGSYTPSVIFVSGFADISARHYCSLGVEGTVSKPAERRQLVALVEKALIDRSVLWSSPCGTENAVSLHIELSTVSEAVARGLIAFGHGGFCLQTVVALPEGPVSLALEFTKEDRTISGEGRVRWCDNNEHLAGVEITSLDAICRDWVYRLTAANPTNSFIPGSTLMQSDKMRALLNL